MEIAVALFLGGWLFAAGVLASRQLERDFKNISDREEKAE